MGRGPAAREGGGSSRCARVSQLLLGWGVLLLALLSTLVACDYVAFERAMQSWPVQDCTVGEVAISNQCSAQCDVLVEATLRAQLDNGTIADLKVSHVEICAVNSYADNSCAAAAQSWRDDYVGSDSVACRVQPTAAWDELHIVPTSGRFAWETPHIVLVDAQAEEQGTIAIFGVAATTGVPLALFIAMFWGVGLRLIFTACASALQLEKDSPAGGASSQIGSSNSSKASSQSASYSSMGYSFSAGSCSTSSATSAAML